MKSLALRLIGHRFDTRFTWGEIGWHPHYWKIGLTFDPAGSFEHNTLIVKALIFSLYIHLPTSRRGDGCMRDKEPSYGFYTIDNSIVWRWGQIYKSFDWPFVSFNHEKTEVLSQDLRSVYTEPRGKWDWEAKKTAEAPHKTTHDYAYVLKGGKIQHRKATIHVERRTWGRKWAPFLKMVQTTIDVEFNEEVGERTGSWKGGCTGCSYQMRKGETPLATLRRMEAERVFN